MAVRIITGDTLCGPCPERDYLHVRTCASPDDDTVTLATIQRFTEKTDRPANAAGGWHIKTLVEAQPMSADTAMGLATRYAERKRINLVVTDGF
ncbi:MAG TPA: hypothetical protein VGC50_11565 [Gammaproteobacteria bacterium]|jgi:hypothetical protein